MAEGRFADGSFDLVTNFWGGYCYSRTAPASPTLWRSAIDLVAPGGALYIEVLLGATSRLQPLPICRPTGFTVAPRSGDYNEWALQDGRRHATS